MEEIVNDTRFVGEAYGIPSPASLEAMDLLGTSEGILLDPISSGKAFLRLVALTQEQAV
jgi:1-aminocyclopropane-1-carboxylate deaminase/D-cysteine desulfhydrase-like pyridoxal-dependent ACC family enzyme